MCVRWRWGRRRSISRSVRRDGRYPGARSGFVDYSVDVSVRLAQPSRRVLHVRVKRPRRTKQTHHVPWHLPRVERAHGHVIRSTRRPRRDRRVYVAGEQHHAFTRLDPPLTKVDNLLVAVPARAVTKALGAHPHPHSPRVRGSLHQEFGFVVVRTRLTQLLSSQPSLQRSVHAPRQRRDLRAPVARRPADSRVALEPVELLHHLPGHRDSRARDVPVRARRGSEPLEQSIERRAALEDERVGVRHDGHRPRPDGYVHGVVGHGHDPAVGVRQPPVVRVEQAAIVGG